MSPYSQGIDTIVLIAHYEAFKKMADKLGLTMQPMNPNHNLYTKILKEVKADTKQRRKKDNFTPNIEIVKLPKVEKGEKKGKAKALYISVVRNTPTLFNVATHNKKPKDSFCMLIFAGLHQPQRPIYSKSIKIISKFLKRKAFKLHRLDFSKDRKDPSPIGKEGLKSFIERFKPYANEQHSELFKNSYYANITNHKSITKINYYSKEIKTKEKDKKVSIKYKYWKRLEVGLTFDVTKAKSFNFVDYINSMNFLNDFSDLEAMAKRAGIKNCDNDYLEYQITSFLDNRFLNSSKNRKQFNLSEGVEFFKKSESKLKRSLLF